MAKKLKDPAREEELRKIRGINVTSGPSLEQGVAQHEAFKTELRSGMGTTSLPVKGGQQGGDGLLGRVALNQPGPTVRAPNGQLGISVSADKTATMNLGTPPATLAGAQGGTVRQLGADSRGAGLEEIEGPKDRKQMKSIADRVVRQEIAGGFGEGNVVPAEGYLSIVQQEGMKREAARTGEYVTRAGGPDGAVLTTMRPSYRNVEIGRGASVPQPVHERYATLRKELGQAAERRFGLDNTREARKAMTDEEAGEARIQAMKDTAADELSGADKGVWDWMTTGKQPKGMKKVYKRVAGAGQDSRAGWTTAKPLPMSPAARKAAGGLAMSKGGVGPGVVPQKAFATADKVLGEGKATAKQVDNHYLLYERSKPEAQQRMLATSENLRQAVALIQGDPTMTPKEALGMAYKIPKKPGAKPIISPDKAVTIAANQLYGVNIQKDVIDPETGLKTGETEATDKYTVKPWDMRDPDREKAMRMAYDDIHERLSNAGFEDKRIREIVRFVASDPLPGDPELNPDVKLLLHNILMEEDGEVQAGDMSADAIDERAAAERRAAQKGTDDLLQDIPAVTAPKKEGEPAQGEPPATTSASTAPDLVRDPQIAELQAQLESLIPMPPKGGTLTDEQGQEILEAVGKDPAKARELAKQGGWVWGK